MSTQNFLFLAFIAMLGSAAWADVPDGNPNPSPFGIMGFQYSHAAKAPQPLKSADEFMELYKLSGARWDRRDFWWSVVQPEPGVWEWDYFDAAMEDFRENQVNLVVILCYGSAWGSGDAPSTDAEIEAFGEYVYQMVNRYQDWVKHWEIWNEPNILPFWAPKPDVETYVKLLETSYRRAREADPDCVILGGAMAGADLRFLRGMYENGAKDSFDALSYHTYGNNPTLEKQSRELDGMRGIMAEYNDDKPIWLTETGIYTGPAGVSNKLQAERIVKSGIRWVAMGVERIFQLTLKDWTDDLDTEDAKSFRGFTKASGEPKPSFFAHRTMVERLGDKEFLGAPILHRGLETYLFGDEDQRVLVSWAEEGEAVDATLNFGARYLLTTSLTGDRDTLQSEGRSYTLQVDQSPVYIEGVGENVLLAASVELAEVRITAGSTAELPLAVTNPFGEPLELLLHFGGNQLEMPRDIAFRLDPGEMETRSIKISAPSGMPSGKHFYAVAADSARTGPIEFQGRVEVGPPAEMTIPPLTDLSGREIPARVANLSNAPIEGDLTLSFDGSEVTSSALELAPGESISYTVPGDPEEVKSGTDYLMKATLVTDGREQSEEFLFRPLKAFRLTSPVTIDGDFDEWVEYEQNIRNELMREEDFNPNLNEGAKDLSAEGWLAWDQEALYIALQVNDDVIHLPHSNVVWDFDSLQLAFDVGNDGVEGETYDRNDFEFQIARLKDGSSLTYAGHYPEGFIDEVVAEESNVAIDVNREEGYIRYEIRLPASILPPLEMAPYRVLGFSLIHNENDTGGPADREGWLELTPGIGYGKEPVYFRDLILMP